MANGFIDAQLVWRNGFRSDSEKQFNKAQCFVDSETIRLMKRFTAARNLYLSEKAPVLGTKIGSGRIYYLAPYGRYQYYGKLMVSSLTGSPYARHGEKKVLTDRNLNYSKLRHPDARAKWFETTKQRYKWQILLGAAVIAGGKAGGSI